MGRKGRGPWVEMYCPEEPRDEGKRGLILVPEKRDRKPGG